jgi:alcohol dehydrogenase
MLVADPALAALGVTARAVEGLKGEGCKVAIYDGFTGEPKSRDIDAATAIAVEARVQAVIGLGGGTALDAAKLVACTAVTAKPAETYQFYAQPLPARAALYRRADHRRDWLGNDPDLGVHQLTRD